jgi:ADP-ribose pyrophosphatase YjhB (NUDIX family)
MITRTAAILTFERMPPFVSTSALVVEGDRLLVVIDPIRHEPVLPGGHLKWREKPEAAVVREVREETGIVIEPRDLVGVFAGEEWSGEPGIVRLIYEARPCGGVLTSSPEGEARWMLFSELAQSHTRDAPVLRIWLARQ